MQGTANLPTWAYPPLGPYLAPLTPSAIWRRRRVMEMQGTA